MTDVAAWTPAFEGQRPPFAPGNTLSVKHGAFSAARTDPIAHDLIAEVLSDSSTAYLQQPRFQHTLWAWASAAAKVQVISEYIDTMSLRESADSARGQTPPLELLRKWMATTQTLSARLGLDPLSAARLGKDVSQAKQADAAGELTKLRTAHEAAEKTPPPPRSDGGEAAASTEKY